MIRMEVVEEPANPVLPVEKETTEEQDAVKIDDMDKNKFDKISDADGNDKFKCKICDHEVNTEGGMK